MNVVKTKNDTSIVYETLSICKQWITNKDGLKFFSPLVVSIPVEILDKERMQDRFGVSGLTIAGNRIFISDDLLICLTPKQIIYFLLNAYMQISHLHQYRLLSIIGELKPGEDIAQYSIKSACCNLAGLLVVNQELDEFLGNYYSTLYGCEHIIGTVRLANYSHHLGWGDQSNVPPEISREKVVDVINNGTVEQLAMLFIKYYNPDNPPYMPVVLYAKPNSSESNGKDMDQMKAAAKELVKAATNAAKKDKQAGDQFCPFELDDLHFLNTQPVSYKSYIESFIEDSNHSWGGYDRRNLADNPQEIIYNYSLESSIIECVIYIDVSGSLVSNIKEILEEVRNILIFSSSDIKVLIKYFSTEVEKADEESNEYESINYITKTSDISEWNLPHNTGGTNWLPVKEDIEDNYSDKNIVVITDGYFYENQIERPRCKNLLWVMSLNHNKEIDWTETGLVGYSDIND